MSLTGAFQAMPGRVLFDGASRPATSSSTRAVPHFTLHRIAVVWLLVTLELIGSGGTAPVLAQDTPIQSIRYQSTYVDSRYGGYQPVTQPPGDQVISHAVTEGYWIVSSRHCVQRDTTCNQCPFQVWHCNGRGQGRESTYAEWAQSLVPGIPCCFMTHGSFVNWKSVIQDSCGTHTWLRQALGTTPLHLTFFTWPSDDPPYLLPQTDVFILGRRASRQGFYLCDLMSRVPATSPITLMGHSHGTRVSVAATHLQGGGEINGDYLPVRQQTANPIRLILAAAAIDHHWLNPGERFECATCRADRITYLLSNKDIPLRLYPFRRPFARSALSVSGLTCLDQRQLGPILCKFSEIDVSPIVGTSHYWPYYYREPSIAAAIVEEIVWQDQVAPLVAPVHSPAGMSPFSQ